MTSAELRARWQQRLDEFRRLGALVSGESIAREVLGDLELLERTQQRDELTLAEAAHESGYSTDHLRHLIAGGQLENIGRKHAPRVRRGDLPRKPGATKAGAGYDADRDALRLMTGGSAQ